MCIYKFFFEFWQARIEDRQKIFKKVLSWVLLLHLAVFEKNGFFITFAHYVVMVTSTVSSVIAKLTEKTVPAFLSFKNSTKTIHALHCACYHAKCVQA